MDAWITKLNPEYRNSSQRNIIAFSFSNEKDLVDHQLEMLRHNSLPCLLNCEVLKVDGLVRLQYDITSYVPLCKMLQRRAMSRTDFFEMLSHVLNLFQVLENYLLDFGGILLDSRFIYCTPGENKLFFIFVPHKDMSQSIEESLKKLLLGLLIQEIKFTDEASDNFVQKLIEELKAPDFNLNALKKYIHSQSRTETIKHKIIENHTEPSLPSKALDLRQRPPLPEKPFQGSLIASKEQIKTKTETKTVYPIKSYIILGSELMGLAALFLVMFLNGSFNPENPDMLTTLVGLLLIGGALTYLVCSKVFVADKKIQKVIELKEKAPRAQPVDHLMQSPQVHRSEGSYVNKSIGQPRVPSQSAPVTAKPISASVPSSEKISDKTVLLSEKNLSSPVLKRLGIHPETIAIYKWPFMIGRLEGQTDFCIQNPAIGKLHTELIQKSEGYYITDMNTRNGTYVNGVRVETNQEIALKSGDKIMLANEEFIFCA